MELQNGWTMERSTWQMGAIGARMEIQKPLLAIITMTSK